jgi:hypothetical protein
MRSSLPMRKVSSRDGIPAPRACSATPGRRRSAARWSLSFPNHFARGIGTVIAKPCAPGRTRYADGQVLAVPAIRRDGTRLSVEFTIVPFNDQKGQICGIGAIMRDVSVRFEEMRALRKRLPAAGQ